MFLFLADAALGHALIQHFEPLLAPGIGASTSIAATVRPSSFKRM